MSLDMMSLDTIAQRREQRHSHPAPTLDRDGAFDPDTRPLDSHAADSSASNEPGRVLPANAEVAIAWRFVACAVAVLTGGIALAAIIVLKTAIYFTRFNYH
jgi:hypothetical protein